MVNDESQCTEREEEEKKQVTWRRSAVGKWMNSFQTFQPVLDSSELRHGNNPNDTMWSRRGGQLGPVCTAVHEKQVVAILCHYA